jgi:hypothetical protein
LPLQLLLFVVGEFEYLFDVAGTAPESIGKIERGDTLLAPAQQATFDGPKPRRWLRRGPSWEVREYEYTLDEPLAAIEPATDLGWHHTVRRKLADPAFEWSKVSPRVHDAQTTATGVQNAAAISASSAVRYRSHGAAAR